MSEIHMWTASLVDAIEQACVEARAARKPVVEFHVWDYTTNNVLGEFDNRDEAEAFLERIRPLGRFGPTGHDLRVIEDAS